MRLKSVCPEYVREALEYDAKTGKFTWKVRPRYHFKTARGWKIFNSRYPGMAAGSKIGSGYLSIYLNNEPYLAHRLAFYHTYGFCPDILDHVNGDRSDNRLANIRPASHADNGANTRLARNNPSGAKGVTWHRGLKKWRVRLTHNTVTLHIGVFDDFELAELVSAEARNKYHGEFARLR